METEHTEKTEQRRFVIDYSREPERLELVSKLLAQANQKPHGRPVVFKDLVNYALGKIGKRDLERIKEMALGEMDRVQILLEKHNFKHGTNLTLGEFLAMKLKI